MRLRLTSRQRGRPGIRVVPQFAQVPAGTHVERRDLPARYALVRRIYREFQEMPGLAVTPGQAARLFGLSPDTAARILERLAATDVLHQTRNGQFTLRVAAR